MSRCGRTPAPRSRSFPSRWPRARCRRSMRGRSVCSLVLGVLCTALAHTLFIAALRTVTAHTASVVAALEPVYGIALAFVLLGEVPGARTLAGGALIVGAAVVATRACADADRTRRPPIARDPWPVPAVSVASCPIDAGFDAAAKPGGGGMIVVADGRERVRQDHDRPRAGQATGMAVSRRRRFSSGGQRRQDARRARRSPTTTAGRGSTGWRREMAAINARGGNAVLACSALKQAYRDRLARAGDVRFVYLKGDRATHRVAARRAVPATTCRRRCSTASSRRSRSRPTRSSSTFAPRAAAQVAAIRSELDVAALRQMSTPMSA